MNNRKRCEMQETTKNVSMCTATYANWSANFKIYELKEAH
jgi:hypothetical protein